MIFNKFGYLISFRKLELAKITITLSHSLLVYYNLSNTEHGLKLNDRNRLVILLYIVV